VDEAVRLADPVLDGEPATDALAIGVEQLEAEHALERAVGRRLGKGLCGDAAQAIVRPPVATFDQLSAEQKAILELVLRRGQGYDRIAGTLGMSEERIRELARGALEQLAPVTARRVESDWRGQVADYVLGQQSGPEATATRGHLRRSEAARSWARSLLDSLETLYTDEMPQIPDGGRERARGPASPIPAPVRARALSAEARAALRRRRVLAAAGALAVLVALIVLVWPVGVLTGGGGGSSTASGVAQPAAQQSGPAGIAIITERGGQRQVVVQAAGLSPTTGRLAYEVWLYNTPKDAESLGAQVTDSRGTFQGAGRLPRNYGKFKYIDVSRERIDRNRGHSGSSVLRGRLRALRPVPPNTKASQTVILGQVLLTPPK
jgi:hypothetical protein